MTRADLTKGMTIMNLKNFFKLLKTDKRRIISALILSLLIIPVATELPEKVNSILWIRRRKDTLPVGNLTGAMVFQGTLLPALGLLTTPWQPELPVVAAITLTILASLWLRWHLHHGGLQVRHLSINGLCYLAYLGSILWIIRGGFQ